LNWLTSDGIHKPPKFEFLKFFAMASRRELQKLEDENRTLCHRLSDIEVELGRKEDALKAANLRYWIVAKYWQLVKSSKKWSQLVVATA